MSCTDPWCIDHYIQKYPYFWYKNGTTNWRVDRMFQLAPEPPEVEEEEEYILLAQTQKNMDAFYFFLHHYEKRLNKRIRQVLVGDCQLRYNPERFLDVKMQCVAKLIQLVHTYDPKKDVKFTTYVYPFLMEAIHAYCKEEEHWAIPSLDIYRQLRLAAFIWNQSPNLETAVQNFMDKTHCTRDTAVRYIEDAIVIRNQASFQVTDPETQDYGGETVDRDDSWNYEEIIQRGIRAQQVRDAFRSLKLDRDRELLELRNACCLDCGRVSPMSQQVNFEDLAVRYEYTSPSSGKKAYDHSVEKLAKILWKRGVIRAGKFQRIREVREGKKITAALYQYQAECDGEWGEVMLNFTGKTSHIFTLADWDTTQSNLYAKAVIRHLMAHGDRPLKSGTFYFS